jgi:hypothetical protein
MFSDPWIGLFTPNDVAELIFRFESAILEHEDFQKKSWKNISLSREQFHNDFNEPVE